MERQFKKKFTRVIIRTLPTEAGIRQKHGNL